MEWKDILLLLSSWLSNAQPIIFGFITFEGRRAHRFGFLKKSDYLLRAIVTITFMSFVVSVIQKIDSISNYNFEVLFISSGFTFFILDIFTVKIKKEIKQYIDK